MFENLNMNVSSPICTYLQLSKICNVTEDVVNGWAKNKHVPTVKIGKYTFINLEKFKQDLQNRA